MNQASVYLSIYLSSIRVQESIYTIINWYFIWQKNQLLVHTMLNDEYWMNQIWEKNKPAINDVQWYIKCDTFL